MKLSILSLLAVLAVASAQGSVNINSPNLFPEGVAYDADREVFYVSSLTTGAISVVSPQSGLILDTINPENVFTGQMTLGLYVDSDRDRLLVCVVPFDSFTHLLNPLFPRPDHTSWLVAVNLTDHELLWEADLTGSDPSEGNVANDVPVDLDGNAYVTDSDSPQIWKVTADGDVSVHVRDEVNFAFEASDIVGLNGIKLVWDLETMTTPYLLAVKSGGKLYRISLDASPTVVDVSIVNGDILGATDGLCLAATGTVVVSGDHTVYSLEANASDWSSVQIGGKVTTATTGVSTCTSGPVFGIYVIHSFPLLAGQAEVNSFLLELVKLDIDPTSDPTALDLSQGIYYADGTCVPSGTCCCSVGAWYFLDASADLGVPALAAVGDLEGAACMGNYEGQYAFVALTPSPPWSLDVEVYGLPPFQMTVDFDDGFYFANITNSLNPFCVSSFTYDPPTCSDGLANGDEEDVDCGGSCGACITTCDDGEQNGDEEAVDCGGSCPTECTFCDDEVQNGDETGVDCGGSCPAECGASHPSEGSYLPEPGCVPSAVCCCVVDTTPTVVDALSETAISVVAPVEGDGCMGETLLTYSFDFAMYGNPTIAGGSIVLEDFGGLLVYINLTFDGDYNVAMLTNSIFPTCLNVITRVGYTGTCDDGIQNGEETGVDCGGSECDACPTCDDEAMNGDETGVDCGGSCDACATCSDEEMNGDETGVDCGGSCDACEDGGDDTTSGAARAMLSIAALLASAFAFLL